MKHATLHPALRSLRRAAALLALAVPAAAQEGLSTDFGTDAGPAAQPPSAGGLPTVFLENRGQWEDGALFAARVGPVSVRLEPQAIALGTARRAQGETRFQITRLRFLGGSEEVVVEGEDPLPGRFHFLYGGVQPVHVSGYESVLYRGLYEGVDLRVREVDGELEYDLLLAPGADVEQVRIACEGVDGLQVTEGGGLLLHTACGDLRQSPPTTWCELPDGTRRALECRAVQLGENCFGFSLAERDPALPVVIDPGLGWATYLGGVARDVLAAVGIDPAGRPIVGGKTNSFDFPDTMGGSLSGFEDAVVACLDPSLSGPAQLVWATFLGGAQEDRILDLEVGQTGRIFAVGMTHSKNFPVTGGAYQGTYGKGTWDGFVVELAPDGSSVVYGSYMGGSQLDYAMALEIAEPRVLTLAGITKGNSFPTTSNAYRQNNYGARDYWFGRMDLDAPGFEYFSYMGTTGNEGFDLNTNSVGNRVIGVGSGPNGEIILAGITGTLGYPTTGNAWDTNLIGGLDMVLTSVDPTMGPAGLLYGTYFGGSSSDGPTSLLVDAQGVVTMGGYSYSADFPVTPGAYEETFTGTAGRNDATLTRFDPTAALPADQLIYATYLGGEGYESVMALDVTPSGAFVGGGFTGVVGLVANSFPVTCDPTFVSDQDTFLFVLSADGNGRSDLHFGVMCGGTGFESVWGLQVHSEWPLVVYAAGASNAIDFPTENAYDSTYGGGASDGIVAGGVVNNRRFCIGAPNSANPDGSHLCGVGSTSVADNAFSLVATGSVPNQPGLFFYGTLPNQVPLGNGVLCLGGQLFRLPPVFGDGAGTVNFPLDFTTLPAGGDIVGGSTWLFQWWYRDPTVGASFNFSSGLEVTFSN